MSFLTRLWDLLRQGLGLVLPLFSRARDYRGLGHGVRWALHVLLVVVLLIALWAVNYYGRLDAVLGRAPNELKQVWLPCLFLLVYALSWLGWWLWKLLWPEKEASDFPDIDDAWDEAVAALHQAGIDLTEAPLFLVLGRPAGGEAALFSAAQLQLNLPGVPRYPDAPARVYASPEGIFVTCPSASLLGRQASLFAAGGPGDDGVAAGGTEPAGKTQDPWATMQATGTLKEIQVILRRAREQGRELSEDERRQVRQLGGADAVQSAARAGRRVTLLKNPADVELFTTRFKHLCSLIVRDRRPYCPVNGILVLVPLAATEGEDVANQVANLCQQDLAAGREVLQLHCPVFGLLCDLETAPGFVQFLERFPEEQRQRRVGQRFPLVPDLPAEELPPILERLVQWICHDLFAIWAYRLFRAETPEKRDMAEAVRGNVQLYQLLRHMHTVDRPLARIVTRGLAVPHHSLILFGGCYIGGTGLDPVEQGFVAGVFRRLIEAQNYVSWTEEGLAEEADYERWTGRGYVALVVLVLVVVAVLGVLYFYPPGA
jgi:hypothetical protein